MREMFYTMRATMIYITVALVLQTHCIPALGARMQTPMTYDGQSIAQTLQFT